MHEIMYKRSTALLCIVNGTCSLIRAQQLTSCVACSLLKLSSEIRLSSIQASYIMEAADEPMEEEEAQPPPLKKQKCTHVCARPCSGVLGRLIRATGGTSYGPCGMKCVLSTGHDGRCDCGIGHDFGS